MLRPNDFGPIYTETNMLRFPVEPWNTYSNIVFLLIVIYWARKLRGKYKEYPFFSIGLPILTIGYIGGTIYHATRSHRIWIYMDFMPIFILLTLTAFHLWYLIYRKMSYSLLFTFLLFFINLFIWKYLGARLVWRASLGYAMSSACIIIPAVILCFKNRSASPKMLILTVAALIAALFARQADRIFGAVFFPMGTHFLWHLFGGASVFFLMHFIYSAELPLKENHGTANRAR